MTASSSRGSTWCRSRPHRRRHPSRSHRSTTSPASLVATTPLTRQRPSCPTVLPRSHLAVVRHGKTEKYPPLPTQSTNQIHPPSNQETRAYPESVTVEEIEGKYEAHLESANKNNVSKCREEGPRRVVATPACQELRIDGWRWQRAVVMGESDLPSRVTLTSQCVTYIDTYHGHISILNLCIEIISSFNAPSMSFRADIIANYKPVINIF